MAALNIHIIHAPALNFASAVSPFSSWPLVATIVRWRFIPKSEVYPIAGAVAMHAMLWLALAHIGRTERIWVQERPAWEQSLDLWELLAQRGVLTLHFPAFCTYTTPARTSPLFGDHHYVRHRQLDQPFYFVLCTQAPFHDLDFEVE